MPQPSGNQSAIFAPSTTAAVVRYQVRDVDSAVAFYTEHLGFELTQKTGPIAVVSRGELHLTAARARFRKQVEVGPGGKQILVDDPDGNPVELHEAPPGRPRA